MTITINDRIFIAALFLMLLCGFIPVIPRLAILVPAFLFIVFLFNDKNPVNKSYQRWLLRFFPFFCVTIIWTPRLMTTLWIVVVNMVPAFLMAISTINFIKDENKLRIVMKTFFWAAICLIVVVLFNIDQFEEGVRFGAMLNEEENLWNSNNIGMTTCFALFFGYIVYFHDSKFWKQFLFLIIGVGMFILILLSGSRKCMIMLPIPILYFLYKKNIKYFLISIPAGAAIIIGLYYLIMNVPLLYSVMGYRMEDMFNIISGNTTGTEDISRALLAEYGIQWFKERPLFGYGLNAFRELSNQTAIFAGRNFYAHNNYIELLVDVGLVGTLLYYSFVIYVFKNIHKQKGFLLNWTKIFLILILFLGVGMVFYYNGMMNFIIAICFAIIELNKENKINENS